MQRGADPVDRRVTGRKEVHLQGRIRLSDGTYLPCVVRDISAMGARLELASDAPVPLAFRLQIPADLFDAECVLSYQSGNLAGVEFTSARAEAMARYG